MNVDVNRASVDFFADLKVFQKAALFKMLDSDYGHVHQGDGLVRAAGVKVGAHVGVFLERGLDQFFVGALLYLYVL